jgi:hypothetical protein
VVLPNDGSRAALDDGRAVAVDAGHGGPMTARIAVTPAADQQATPVASSGNALRGVY